MIPIEEIAAKTRLMPDHFINKAGNNMTDDFIHYLVPLLGSDTPDYATLRAPMAPRILKI